MPDRDELAERARANDVLWTPGLRELVPASTLSRWVGEGGWSHPQSKVVRPLGARRDRVKHAAEVMTSIGGAAWITGFFVLWAVGLLPSCVTTVDVVVCAERAPRPRKGAVIHRVSWFDPQVDAVPMTTPPQTSVAVALLYVARTLDEDPLRNVFIDAVQRGLTTPRDVIALCVRAKTVKGAGRLRRIAEALADETSDSALEHAGRRRVERMDFPPPHPHPYAVETPRRTLHIDIPWPEYYTGIECHGGAKLREARGIDKHFRRENHLAASRWRTVGLTWRRLFGDFDAFWEEFLDLVGFQADLYGLPWPPAGFSLHRSLKQ